MAIDNAILRSVLNEYNISDKAIIQPFGTGLINNTWVVKDGDQKYILQRINDNVFKEPKAIDYNIEYIADHLRENFPAYKFASPITASNGETLIYKEGAGYFRIFHFIDGSHTIDVVET